MDRGYVFAQVWITVYQLTGSWSEANERATNTLKWFDRTSFDVKEYSVEESP